jgi:hypothetical protein
MKESYREGVANHSGPEPCEGGGNVALEALDRGICRLGIELRNLAFRGADGVRQHGRQQRAIAKTRARRDPAESKCAFKFLRQDPRHAEKLHAREPGDPVAARR